MLISQFGFKIKSFTYPTYCPFKQFRSKAVLLLSALKGRTYGTDVLHADVSTAKKNNIPVHRYSRFLANFIHMYLVLEIINICSAHTI